MCLFLINIVLFIEFFLLFLLQKTYTLYGLSLWTIFVRKYWLEVVESIHTQGQVDRRKCPIRSSTCGGRSDTPHNTTL